MRALERYSTNTSASSRQAQPELLLRSYRDTCDPAARERLVELYMPLVRTLARRYDHRGEHLEDLIQVGSIGLIEAIDRFDPERGSDLASFAIPTIVGEIKNHLRDRATTVRVPRRFAELTVRLRAPRETLTARLSRPPTVSELAREAGLREGEVAEAIRSEVARTPVPLLAAEDGDGHSDAAVVVDGGFDSSDDRLVVAAGFRMLGERERRILHLRFYAGLSQVDIAREVGLSQVQVSRLIRASLARMRVVLDDERPRNRGTEKSLLTP